MTDRRHVLLGFSMVSLTALAGSARAAGGLSPHPMPAPDSLEAGDLLWPKEPGAFIPYDYASRRDPAEDNADWLGQRGDAMVALGASVGAEIDDLNYAEFRNRYLQGIGPGEFTTHSLGSLASVGHVAIVDMTDGVPWVIEAMYGEGVVRRSFADWVALRPRDIVWHGRLLGRTAAARQAFAAEAATQVGKPYNFWNFDLGDDQDFYCSKLVWLSHQRAFGAAVDGNPEPRRSFWFSPKQLLRLPAVEVLLDQGDYAFD